ncbi:alpha-2,8-sialyltransferase 8F-like isoform X2 [Synchiropus splendidus]|uniref:alpha-2,8-sialyltransferase 8F-like isoform X2 n=1 Tax=Synchiropus splendidus TaxID=270530 RepID=UPI00237DFC2D|nr:alpha-2,8-sialyltransferase 8F-like isoform X2 [Synchiropus splendidus]
MIIIWNDRELKSLSHPALITKYKTGCESGDWLYHSEARAKWNSTLEMKSFIICVVICLGTLMTTLFWAKLDRWEELHQLPRMRRQPMRPSQYCKGCQKLIQNTTDIYSKRWQRLRGYYTQFRLKMQNEGIDVEDAIISKTNFPVGSNITEKLMRNPLFNKTWDTCSVVGNGGILFDSHCGKKIDSADFVIRCNLPPLHGTFGKHVGTKSSFVTANPSILRKIQKENYSEEIMEKMKPYDDAIIALPDQNPLVFETISILRELKSPSRPVFLNPKYMSKLTDFWRSRGVKAARLSSGLFMVSMALELCRNVHVYGFWPFSIHPFGLYFLPHHYYDDTLPRKFHKMPVEFDLLLQLHTQGVIRIQLGACRE